MKMQRRSHLTRILLCLLVVACLTAQGLGQCATATGTSGWVNTPFAVVQTGTFSATFDATPLHSNMNSVVGLSQGAGVAYSAFANLVAFNGTQGMILARNGGGYAAQTNVPYTGGVTYHFRLVVNVPAHTYSIFVTPAGGSELIIGNNYAFRNEQSTVTSLNNYGVFVGTAVAADTLTVCNFAISSGGVADFSLSASPTSQTITAGGSTTYSVNIGAINGFSSGVTLSVSGLPTGATGELQRESGQRVWTICADCLHQQLDSGKQLSAGYHRNEWQLVTLGECDPERKRCGDS